MIFVFGNQKHHLNLQTKYLFTPSKPTNLPKTSSKSDWSVGSDVHAVVEQEQDLELELEQEADLMVQLRQYDQELEAGELAGSC